jgi:hypothetical protein
MPWAVSRRRARTTSSGTSTVRAKRITGLSAEAMTMVATHSAGSRIPVSNAAQGDQPVSPALVQARTRQRTAVRESSAGPA